MLCRASQHQAQKAARNLRVQAKRREMKELEQKLLEVPSLAMLPLHCVTKLLNTLRGMAGEKTHS